MSNSKSNDNSISSCVQATEALLEYNVSPTDIEKYKKIYRNQVCNGEVDMDTKFRYAWCLVHSKVHSDVKNSLPLLEELFQKGNEQTKRDSLFYLAVAHTKLKEYTEAKKYVTAFLSVEPTNTQAEQLDIYIAKRLKRDGIAGIAIVGGAAVLGAVVAVGIAGAMLATGVAVSFFKMKRR